MRDNVPCEFPAGHDGTAILERLAQVLDPELDESILDLGFVRSLQLRSGHVSVALRLPTSWCAVNFAYLMAEDVRRALLTVEGVRQVTLRLTFLRKGFLGRQERLLRELREAGCSPAVICALRLGDMSVQDDRMVIRQPGCAPHSRIAL